ncbi:MAG: hypothetical protein IKH04_07445 [Kiritimatiellae bacterium]|nr:hypothetical protein [Kiritimatiellia bacterium]
MKKQAIGFAVAAFAAAALAQESPRALYGGTATAAPQPRSAATQIAPRYKSTYRGYDDYGFDDFRKEWIDGCLSVGLTLSTMSLDDGHRPANRDDDFLGNINELKKDGGTVVAPTINYRLFNYFLFGLSYTKVEARTMNFNNHLSDGNAELKGLVLTAEVAYPLFDDLFIPHAGVGFAPLSGDFSMDSWWHAGYASPEDYERLGRDNSRYARHRYIDVDDESCIFLNVGVSCKLVDHLLLDISWRKLSLDPDCKFGYESGGHKTVESTGDFDMGCTMLLFSASYLF